MPNETPSAPPPPSPPAPALAGPPPGVPTPPPAAVKYPLDDKTLSELNERFEYHAPKVDQVPRYNAIRAKARELALLIVTSSPKSREQALALTHIDEAMLFANAAIARNE